MTPGTERGTVRPTPVTVAFWLQLTAAFLLLALVGAAVAYAVYFDGEISRAAELVPDADPVEVEDERAANVIATLVVAVPMLVLGIWLAVTAVPVRRGSKAGRILVFVAAGGALLLCALQTCGVLLFAPVAFLADGEDPSSADDDWLGEDSEFLKALYRGSDSLFDLLPLGVGLGVFLAVVLVGTVVLLLALPPANRYFVPGSVPPSPEQRWPGTNAGYPLMPGHPVYLVGPPPAQGPYLICPDPAAHQPAAAPPRDE